MSHPMGENFGQPNLLVADSVADRLLRALELDYLYTLQAGQKQRRYSVHAELHSRRNGSSWDDRCSTASKRDAEVEFVAAETAADATISTDASRGVPIDEVQNWREGLPLQLGNRADEGDDSDSSAEPPTEFAYELLPSTEHLPPLSSFPDDFHCLQSATSSSNVWAKGSCQLPSLSTTCSVDASAGGSRDTELAADHDSGGSPVLQPMEAPSEAHFIPNITVDTQVMAAVADTQLQKDASVHQRHSIPHVHQQRSLPRGETPLPPESAAFITEVMRNLSLRDPRGGAPPDLAG